MIKWTAIAAVVMEFTHLADDAFLDQTMRGLLPSIPDEWPVHGEQFPVRLHGGDHRIRLGQRSGKGFLHDDVRAERCDLCHPLTML